ncbi:MAG: hypothetical protein ACR2LI_11800 [Propionibacteriaceae bacterium]
MSEGITVARGRLYVTHESGASVYRGHLNPFANSKNPIYSVHSASTSRLIARL